MYQLEEIEVLVLDVYRCNLYWMIVLDVYCCNLYSMIV